MIKSFADRRTEHLYLHGRSREFPPVVLRRAIRTLDAIDAASNVVDLQIPPGNRLHALEGDRQGQHAIAINDQWRICFRFLDGDAYDVEITDYH
ncbi:MAG: type II toxin-antitoxin system RelE/ParE family toxin [Bacteroidetes bacterium]|nr:type II toxin-antitoxin system RelE/ParE family toxin [Bacteroidota bacterium]